MTLFLHLGVQAQTYYSHNSNQHPDIHSSASKEDEWRSEIFRMNDFQQYVHMLPFAHKWNDIFLSRPCGIPWPHSFKCKETFFSTWFLTLSNFTFKLFLWDFWNILLCVNREFKYFWCQLSLLYIFLIFKILFLFYFFYFLWRIVPQWMDIKQQKIDAIKK